MRIALVLFLFMTTTTTAQAALSPELPYYPASFYQHDNQGSDLRDELFLILNGLHQKSDGHDEIVEHCQPNQKCTRHESLGYRRARELLFGDIHLQKTQKGYAVFDVYCERLVTENVGPGMIPNEKQLNTEHTWPQSHFTNKFRPDMQKSDLHHLYPTDTKANSTRGNLHFEEVVSQKESPCAPVSRGYSSDGKSEEFFEPPTQHKGNVARAIFYFATRYQMRVPSNEEASLKAWNKQDPPDDFERARNNRIAELQGDRNPFIDYPELIDRISDF